MNRTRFLMLSSASVIGLTVAFTAPQAAQTLFPAQDRNAQVQTVDYDDKDHRWGGWRHRRGHKMICSDFRDEKVDKVVEFVESFVDFTPPQSAAWQKLTEAVRSGSDRIGEACKDDSFKNRPVTSAEKLDMAEKLLTIGLDIIRQVRPAYDEFYTSLDDRQKKAIDSMFRRYRRI